MLKQRKYSQEDIDQFANLIKTAQHVYAVTGAGISTTVGIPDLEHLSRSDSRNLSSEIFLEQDPDSFYKGFQRLFVNPIFKNGPSTSHFVLAELEKKGLLDGVVTTNVDYLHEIAGNIHVADIWSNININHCLDCGRTFPLDILNQKKPRCPVCGGLISPDPIYQHIGIDESQYAKANRWMQYADLVITIGTNGYYDNITPNAKVIDINPKRDPFSQTSSLKFKSTADPVMNDLAASLGL